VTGIALSVDLPDDAVDALIDRLVMDSRLLDRLAQTLEERGDANPGEQWMTTRQAAEYLGLSVAALHRLTAARAVPFEQGRPNARCWFQRRALDAWRAAGEPPTASNVLPLKPDRR
jgi:hypothetical protein